MHRRGRGGPLCSNISNMLSVVMADPVKVRPRSRIGIQI